MKTPRLSMLANRVSPASQRLMPSPKTVDLYSTQAVIKRAVNAAALALLARDQTVAEVVAALTGAVDGSSPADVTPRECVAAVRKSRRQAMLAELERLEQEGRGRDAAMMVAGDFAADRLDPVEVASLARKLRRWRREKNGQCPSPVPETI